MKVKDNIVVALDVGSTKVVCLVGRLNVETQQFDILSIGRSDNKGMKRGVVVDIEETVKAIGTALMEARYMGDCDISHVYLNVGGAELHSFNSAGMVSIKHQEVTQKDVERVIDTANSVSIPANHEFLTVLPQKYRIGEQEEISNPIGMIATRLEVSTHIITGPKAISQNITNCAMKCKVHVDDLVVSPLASAEACLTEDEKNLGVCVIDIGGGTTDISVYANGCSVFNRVLAISGEHITNDISAMLRTPTGHAEELKKRYGVAKESLVDVNDIIDIPGVGDRPIRKARRSTLSSVIQCRVEELFQFVRSELEEADVFNYLNAGIVLTGGTSKLVGISELAEDVFEKSVRIATPQYDGNLSDIIQDPSLSAAYGILLCSGEYMSLSEGALPPEEDWFSKIWGMIKKMFVEH